MFWLLILTLSGTALGSIGGAFLHGYDGTIMGASVGVVGGVLSWTVLGMIERINSERRLDRYFRGEHVE
jgi:hypothetical protein